MPDIGLLQYNPSTGVMLPFTPTLLVFPIRIVDIFFKDDVSGILLLGVSFIKWFQ
jgi:hypothetical protein